MKKKIILSSIMTIAVCLSIAVGATFALFTSESKVNIAATAGTVEVVASVNDESVKLYSLGVEQTSGVFENLGTATLTTDSTNGTTLTLDNITPGDKVAFTIDIENNSTVTVQYRTKLVCVEDNGLYDGLVYSIGGKDSAFISNWEKLQPNSPKTSLDCAIELPENVGNQYQGKTCKIAFTVEAVQGNAETKNDTAFYTLAQFNALTEIPAGIENVYLSLGAVSLKDGSVVIGNENISDIWTFDRDTTHAVGDVLDDGRLVYEVRTDGTIYSSNKPGIKLYISGSVNENAEGGLNQSNSKSIILKVPDATEVVFTSSFTVNGYFRMFTGWSDGRNLGGAFINRTVKSVLFDHSTFNGIWVQNGGFFTNSVTLDGCTFNAYENKVSANDSNPLWWCNIRDCDVTVKNCTFKASRPIKIVEQGVFGAKVTITGNTFDMSFANSADKTAEPKNVAVMFSMITADSTLDNVVVSGNAVTGATALLAFYNPSQLKMAEGATFKVFGNTLNGAKESVQWKTNTAYEPDFVTAE